MKKENRYTRRETFPVPQATKIGNLSAFRINLVQDNKNKLSGKES